MCYEVNRVKLPVLMRHECLMLQFFQRGIFVKFECQYARTQYSTFALDGRRNLKTNLFDPDALHQLCQHGESFAARSFLMWRSLC